jgi:hypothetical protein
MMRDINLMLETTTKNRKLKRVKNNKQMKFCNSILQIGYGNYGSINKKKT